MEYFKPSENQRTDYDRLLYELVYHIEFYLQIPKKERKKWEKDIKIFFEELEDLITNYRENNGENLNDLYGFDWKDIDEGDTDEYDLKEDFWEMP